MQTSMKILWNKMYSNKAFLKIKLGVYKCGIKMMWCVLQFTSPHVLTFSNTMAVTLCTPFPWICLLILDGSNPSLQLKADTLL